VYKEKAKRTTGILAHFYGGRGMLANVYVGFAFSIELVTRVFLLRESWSGRVVVVEV